MKLNSKSLLSISSALAFTAQSVSAAEEASAVINLDKIGFELTVSHNKLGLVGFYSPQDETYKTWADKYEAAAKLLKNRKIPVGLVNCDENIDFCKEFNFSGKSFVTVFGDNYNMYDFEEPYEIKNFVQHMINNKNSDSSELKTIADIELFVKYSNKPVIVNYGNEDLKEKFTNIASKYSEKFVFVSIEKGAEGESPDANNFLAIYSKYYKTPLMYNGDMQELINDEFNFINWALFAGFPLVGDIDESNVELYANLDVPVATFFYQDEDDKKIAMESLESLAKEYKNRIVFATMNGVKFGGSLKNIHMRDQLPAFCIINPSDNTSYGLPQLSEEDFKKLDGRYAIYPEELTMFMNEFVSGRIPPNGPSEIVHDEL